MDAIIYRNTLLESFNLKEEIVLNLDKHNDRQQKQLIEICGIIVDL